MSSAVSDVGLWYHTIEFAPGEVTPGWFDLRGRVDKLPWPDVAGRRCLDVATWDGFFAFELERRGAASVVATDIERHEDWDWLPRDRHTGPAVMAAMAGEKGRGFDVARQRLGSSVERRLVSVYDLDPARDGTFDVVVVGSLLLHLRDPFRALEAVHRVCDGWLLSIEAVDLATSLLHRRRPVTYVEGVNGRWLVPNTAGHARMLEVAGFHVEDQVLLDEPLGPGHPDAPRGARRAVRGRVRDTARRVRFGGTGVPASAVRARPVP